MQRKGCALLVFMHGFCGQIRELDFPHQAFETLVHDRCRLLINLCGQGQQLVPLAVCELPA